MSVGKELKGLGVASAIYLVPTILMRGVNFLLTPVYTRVMTPDDYGITGVANTVMVLLITALGFGIHTTTYRLHYQWKTEEERARFYGTLLVFLGVAPLLITALLHLIGAAGGLDFFEYLEFYPHLVLVIWAAYFSVFQSLPLNILMVREMPRAASLYNLATFVITVAVTLYFVVYLRQGAVGQLRASLVAAGLVALVSISVVWRFAKPAFSWAQLSDALAYGIPLVPHLIANWGLAVADRLVLEQHVDKGEVGRYTLAYTFAAIATIASGSVMRAFFPIISRKLAEDDGAKDVPRLGTFVVLGMVFVSLGSVLLSHEAIELLTPAAYHGAARYVPLLTLGVVFQTIYQLWSQGTFFSKKTKMVPVLTAIAVGVNVVLNLLLVPRYGAIAAAFNTAIAYALLAALHGWLAQRTYPIAWEYAKWARVLGAGAAAYAAGAWATALPIAAALAVKLLVCFVLFPALLALFGFASVAEMRGLVSSAFAKVRGRLRRRAAPRAT